MDGELDLADQQPLDDQEYVIEGITHNKIINYLEVELTEDSKGEFSYKEVSDISDVTEESYPEGLS